MEQEKQTPTHIKVQGYTGTQPEKRGCGHPSQPNRRDCRCVRLREILAVALEALYIPAALALCQRPSVPGIRSTFGTGTELLNSLRLIFSRLASHCCSTGNYLEPSLKVSAEQELVCPECDVYFFAPSAEKLAFNSQGASRQV